MSTMEAAALDLAARGLMVFPCRPQRQTPLTDHGHLDATADPEVIRRWYARWPRANVALACASSGLLAVDVDPRHDGDSTVRQLTQSHGRLPPTVTAATGGGGWHLLFKLPGGVLRGAAGAGVDLKHNGYIVAAPSIHPSGRRYRWLDGRAPGDLPLAELPPEWLTIIVKPARAPTVAYVPRDLEPGSDGTPYGIAALRRECESLANAPEGERNNRLNAAAFSLAQLAAGGELDEGVARAALLDAAHSCGLVTDEGDASVLRTLASGWGAGLQHPRCRHAS